MILVQPNSNPSNVSFASIVADVMTITNRPDLVNETNLAVQAATLKAHQKDDWIKDFYEQSIGFPTSDYFQSLDYKSVFPLWRKPKYIRKYDNTAITGGPTDFLEYLTPEKVVDNYGANRTDVFYVAGSLIQIRVQDPYQYFLVGYYANPDITTAGYASWIANDHKFAIVYEAAAIIFKATGLDEQVAMMRDMVNDQYALLTQHALTGIGL